MTSSLSREAMDAALIAFRETLGANPRAASTVGALESAITAYLSATGWRTIDSAPKDGTRILGYVLHEQTKWPCVAYWDDMGGEWMTDDIFSVRPKLRDGITVALPLTHWMPLPTPPESRP